MKQKKEMESWVGAKNDEKSRRTIEEKTAKKWQTVMPLLPVGHSILRKKNNFEFFP